MPFPAEIAIEDVPCPAGCARQDEPVLIGRDRWYGLPGDFPVVRCGACGLMRTNPRPTEDSIAFYYPEQYWPYQSHAGDAAAPRPWWRRLAKWLLPLNVDRIPPLPPGHMLEVGCGSGDFLRQLAAQGWAVEGMEASERAAMAVRSRGLRVHVGPLATAPEPERSYDLIVGWMVLEHLHHPVTALRLLRRWVRPGGWLVLSVPNAAGLGFALFQDAWYDLDVPRHLYHFTPQTLARLLQQGGWRMDRVFYQRSFSGMVASVGYKLREHRLVSSLAGAFAALPERVGKGEVAFYPLTLPLSLAGKSCLMTVWARPDA